MVSLCRNHFVYLCICVFLHFPLTGLCPRSLHLHLTVDLATKGPKWLASWDTSVTSVLVITSLGASLQLQCFSDFTAKLICTFNPLIAHLSFMLLFLKKSWGLIFSAYFLRYKIPIFMHSLSEYKSHKRF